MTLVDALRAATQALDRTLRPMTQLGVGLQGAHQFMTGVPANLADIIRDAEVHRTFHAGPPSGEMQRVLHDALFHPPTFRALGPPGVLPGPPHPEITRAIFEALFHPQSLNVPWQRLDLPRQSLNVTQLITPGGAPPRRL
jgi:hypothetical protein